MKRKPKPKERNVGFNSNILFDGSPRLHAATRSSGRPVIGLRVSHLKRWSKLQNSEYYGELRLLRFEFFDEDETALVRILFRMGTESLRSTASMSLLPCYTAHSDTRDVSPMR